MCQSHQTHMIRRSMFSIQRFGDKHLSERRVDAEHLIGWLICSHPSNAVSDWNVLVLVGTNLHDKQKENVNIMDIKPFNASQCV